MIEYGKVWYGMVCYGMVEDVIVIFGMVWYGMVLFAKYSMVQYALVLNRPQMDICQLDIVPWPPARYTYIPIPRVLALWFCLVP